MHISLWPQEHLAVAENILITSWERHTLGEDDAKHPCAGTTSTISTKHYPARLPTGPSLEPQIQIYGSKSALTGINKF